MLENLIINFYIIGLQLKQKNMFILGWVIQS